MSVYQRTLKALGAAVRSWKFSSLVDAASWRERIKRPYEQPALRAVFEDVSLSDHMHLVSDSRKLYANVGAVKAQIDDKAMYSIGRAWVPVFEGENKEWGELAKRYLVEQWMPVCDVRGLDFQTHLYLLSVCIDRDGDVFPAFTQHSTGMAALDIVSATRVYSKGVGTEEIKSGRFAGTKLTHGCFVNSRGRTVGWRVWSGDTYQDFDLFQMAQLMEPSWPDQLRGMPGLTHALLDIRDLRLIQGFEREACALASSIGLLEFNETGTADLSDPAIRFSSGTQSASNGRPVVENLDGGRIRYFKANSGARVETLKSERPGDAWQKLMDRLIRNACAGFGWPYELTWDSSALGGANIRLITAKAQRSVEDRQALLGPYARRAVGYAISKAIKDGELPPSDEWFRWGFTMPRRISVDMGRDSANQRADLEAGITTLAAILEEQGGDLETHIKRRVEERDKLAAAGLSPTQRPPAP